MSLNFQYCGTVYRACMEIIINMKDSNKRAEKKPIERMKINNSNTLVIYYFVNPDMLADIH